MTTSLDHSVSYLLFQSPPPPFFFCVCVCVCCCLLFFVVVVIILVFVCFVASDVLTTICHLAIVNVCMITILSIGNTQISILLLCFLYLFVCVYSNHTWLRWMNFYFYFLNQKKRKKDLSGCALLNAWSVWIQQTAAKYNIFIYHRLAFVWRLSKRSLLQKFTHVLYYPVKLGFLWTGCVFEYTRVLRDTGKNHAFSLQL